MCVGKPKKKREKDDMCVFLSLSLCVYVCMKTQEEEGGEEILQVHREKRETKTERERQRKMNDKRAHAQWEG